MNLASYDMFKTPLQFQKHIRVIANIVSATFKAVCPYDTGELSGGIFPVIIIGRDKNISIRINIGQNVDYAGATNEPWINRPGTNPNEGWIWIARDLATELVSEFIKDPSASMEYLPKDIKEEMKETMLGNIEVIDE